MPRVPALIRTCSTIAAIAVAAAAAGGAIPPGKTPPLSANAARGLAFAQARCSGCHGISRNSGSPNPEAPSFEDIVNKPGLSRTTLRAFLRDSHNYPAAMNFTIDRAQIGHLADYMVTLKSRNYRPGI